MSGPQPFVETTPAHLVFPGIAGNYLTCENRITDTQKLGVTWKGEPDDWATGAEQSLVTVWDRYSGKRSWSLKILATGNRLQWVVSDDSVSVALLAESDPVDTSVGFCDGKCGVGSRYTSDYGSGASQTSFFQYQPMSTHIGDSIGAVAVPAVTDGFIEVGAWDAGNAALFTGKVSEVRITGGLSSGVWAHLLMQDIPLPNFSRHLSDGETWLDSSGARWTVHGDLIYYQAEETHGGTSGWRVEFGIGDVGALEGIGLWGQGRWMEDRWGSASLDAYLVDVTPRVQSLSVNRGRRKLTGRFKTGVCNVVVDNQDGAFTPDTASSFPSLLPMAPGRAVRVTKDDGTVFWGYIDTMEDVYGNDGNVAMRVVAYDVFSDLALNKRPAVTDEGAGDTSLARIERIRDRFYPGLQVEARLADGDTWETMQATTMAQDALNLMQLTSDSEGGGLWASRRHVNGDPQVVFVSRNWFRWRAELQTDWQVGGSSPIRPVGVSTERSKSRIYNEAHYSRRGGTEQAAYNTASQSRFGRRTHTRLDLENDQDDSVGELAQRLVDFAGIDRLRLTDLTFVPEVGSETDQMCSTAEIGDTMLVTVDSPEFHWTRPTQVFGVIHDVTPEQWTCTFLVDDSVFDADYAAFNGGFDDGFDIGGN